ncbi:hydroxypyruvate isomerase [Escherichia coli]|nr:hydroxypyruvate isomerase [Escherichia coli]
MLMKEDILLLIEPINHFDIPGFHLTGTRQALKLIDDVGCCNLKIQYDIYHMQRMEGELTNTMTQWLIKLVTCKLPIIRIAANREPEKLIMIISLNNRSEM